MSTFLKCVRTAILGNKSLLIAWYQLGIHSLYIKLVRSLYYL